MIHIDCSINRHHKFEMHNRRPLRIIATIRDWITNILVSLCRKQTSLVGKNLSVDKRIHLSMQESCVRSLDWEDPLEEETATHYSILVWEIPWTEKPGRLPWGHKESKET